MKLPQISHKHKKCNFESKIVTFYTNCFYPTNFMAVAYAFRHVSKYGTQNWNLALRGIELKLGIGVGMWPRSLRAYFRSDPPKVEIHLEVKLLSICPMASTFGRKNHWSKCKRIAIGSKVMQGSPGSTRGQNAQKWPMPSMFDEKSP